MSHEKRGKSNDWYTPKYVFEALHCVFNMDVCSPVDRRYCHVPAYSYLTEKDIAPVWEGFIWMNPPYGNEKDKVMWLRRFFEHNNGICLMPDRTSAGWWQYAADKADALLIVKHKIKFISPNGDIGKSPSNGTTLFACGHNGVNALHNGQKNGLGIVLKKQ